MPAQPGEQAMESAERSDSPLSAPARAKRRRSLPPGGADRSRGRGAVAAYSCQQLAQAAWALAVLDARLDAGPLPAAWAELGRRAAVREARLLPLAVLRQVHQARRPRAAREPARCGVRDVQRFPGLWEIKHRSQARRRCWQPRCGVGPRAEGRDAAACARGCWAGQAAWRADASGRPSTVDAAACQPACLPHRVLGSSGPCAQARRDRASLPRRGWRAARRCVCSWTRALTRRPTPPGPARAARSCSRARRPPGPPSSRATRARRCAAATRVHPTPIGLGEP